MKLTTLRELGGFVLVGFALILVLALSNCAPNRVALPSPVAESPSYTSNEAGVERSSSRSSDFAPTERRPGLATGWGESIDSELGRTSFTRASDRPYGGVGTIYYNTKEGVEAMGGSYLNRTSAYQKAGNGTVEWAIKSGWGHPTHYMSGNRRFVVGKKGRNYSIVVRNVSEGRVELVASVDGLDVMDGKSANFRKRGYILGPGEELEIEGFRTSFDSVAAFKFSSVDASYASLRHGDTRNVGVIGLAVFAEKGARPWRWDRQEVGERRSAQPFAEAPLRTAR